MADPERLAALIDRANTVGRQTERRLADIEQLIGTLHIDWEGDAADAHRAAHEKWNRGASEMSAALAQLGAMVRAAKDRYVGTVAHNARMWP